MFGKPLTDLLKLINFHWNEEASSAFEKLKVAMTTTYVLAVIFILLVAMVTCIS